MEIKYFISIKRLSSAGQKSAGQTGPWYSLIEDKVLYLHIHLQKYKVARNEKRKYLHTNSVSLEHFVERKPVISEECTTGNLIWCKIV